MTAIAGTEPLNGSDGVKTQKGLTVVCRFKKFCKLGEFAGWEGGQSVARPRSSVASLASKKPLSPYADQSRVVLKKTNVN